MATLADALEAIAGALRALANSTIPSSPEAAAAGLPDSDEAQAIAAFHGQAVVTLDDVRFVTRWGRERILSLVKSGELKPLPGTGSKACPYEFSALSVWRYIHQRDKASSLPEQGKDINILPPSRSRRRGAAA